METKMIEVQICTTEVHVMSGDNGTEIWVPAIPVGNVECRMVADDGPSTRDVHKVILVKCAESYSRLFAGKTFAEPVKINALDWGRETVVISDDTVDVVTRRFGFVCGTPFPAPTLEALAKEYKEVDDFYHSVDEVEKARGNGKDW